MTTKQSWFLASTDKTGSLLAKRPEAWALGREPRDFNELYAGGRRRCMGRPVRRTKC